MWQSKARIMLFAMRQLFCLHIPNLAKNPPTTTTKAQTNTIIKRMHVFMQPCSNTMIIDNNKANFYSFFFLTTPGWQFYREFIHKGEEKEQKRISDPEMSMNKNIVNLIFKAVFHLYLLVNLLCVVI
jgi:hypothetical protein